MQDGAAPRLPREVRVLAFCAFMIAIGYGVVAPALPALARSFDVSVRAAYFAALATTAAIAVFPSSIGGASRAQMSVR